VCFLFGPCTKHGLNALSPQSEVGYVLPFLIEFVVVITTTAVVAILPLVVLAIVLVALPAVATATSVTSFHHMADLLIVPLAQFMAHIVSHALLDLTLNFFAREPSATCKLKMFSKYSATDLSILLLRH
jgi:hypothetical protein